MGSPLLMFKMAPYVGIKDVLRYFILSQVKLCYAHRKISFLIKEDNSALCLCPNDLNWYGLAIGGQYWLKIKQWWSAAGVRHLSTTAVSCRRLSYLSALWKIYWIRTVPPDDLASCDAKSRNSPLLVGVIYLAPPACCWFTPLTLRRFSCHCLHGAALR